MMGYDSLLGSHFDKYYVDYARWESPARFNDDDFAIPKSKFDVLINRNVFNYPFKIDYLLMQLVVKVLCHINEIQEHINIIKPFNCLSFDL